MTTTCKILFLAANPDGTAQLSLDEESREITEKIRASEHRDALQLITRFAVRPDDLLQALNEHQPQIVHFSGHGTRAEEIILQDVAHRPQPIPKAALKYLFRTLKDNIRVVMLNACYSRSQAEAITEEIDCAIGMRRAIGDQAATTFAASFYRGLGFGRSVQEAFDQGKAALMFDALEENTPELLVRAGADASKIYLVGDRATATAGKSSLSFVSPHSQPEAVMDQPTLYDSESDPSGFRYWTGYSTVGGFGKRISADSMNPEGKAAIRLTAYDTELVGANKSVRSVRGCVEFRYHVESSASPGLNVFFYVIPMQTGKSGQSGLIEVGTSVEGDARNAFSPYRARFVVPRHHYGDGLWHTANLPFDFTDISEAFYSIFAPRINEGSVHPAAALIFTASVQIFG